MSSGGREARGAGRGGCSAAAVAAAAAVLADKPKKTEAAGCMGLPLLLQAEGRGSAVG